MDLGFRVNQKCRGYAVWKRDILFLGMIGFGGVALAANLVPPRETKPLDRFDAHEFHAPDVRETVAKVNASFRSYWSEHKVTPVGQASDLTVQRRLGLGLMGTIPSLEEIRQFEWLPAEERISWWIEHIFHDNRYTEHVAERIVRSVVGTEDGPFVFFRRRRFGLWVGEQLEKNKAYDEIAREIIATKGLWTDKPATNFVSVTRQEGKENQPDPIRLAGRVTRAFLGLRLDCAQCHNHPFTDWKQSDFEGLAAFFGQTHIGFTGVYDGEGEFEPIDRRTLEKKVVAPRVPFAVDLLPEEGTRRQRLAEWATHAKNPNFSKAAVNRVWAWMFGRALVEPIDNLETDQPIPPALEILANDFAEHHFDLRRLIRIIASTDVFRLASASEDREITEAEEKVWAAFPLVRLRPEQVVGGAFQASSVATVNVDSHILIRLIRLANTNDFVKRYGDLGDDEFENRGGTITQRLLMMNGNLVHDFIKEGMFTSSSRIATQSRDASHAIESAYLTVLTRRPTDEELRHFEELFADTSISKTQRTEDLFWALINSTEFSWNH